MTKLRRILLVLANVFLILSGIASLIISAALTQGLKDTQISSEGSRMLLDACRLYFLGFGVLSILLAILNFALIPWKIQISQ